MDVFDLAAKIRLDTNEYEKGLDGAKSESSSFASKLKSSIGAAAKVATASIAAVTTATVALGKTFYNQTKEIASYGDNIDKMSQKMGLSAEAYQEWDAIMQHSGTSIESLKPAIKTLATAAESGNEAFAKLGITQEEVAELSQEDLFARVISELQKMEEGTERTYLAGQLLGRGATELGALLNTSAEDTEKMRQAVHELGGVMSNEAIKTAAKYQDTLQDMNTAFAGAKRAIFADFMPSVIEAMEGLTKLFSGDKSGVAAISKGITTFIKNITKKLPEIIKVGTEIVSSVAQGITENIDEFLDLAEGVIEYLGNALIDAFPKIVDVGMKIIERLINGISKNTPKIISAAVKIISSIATTLIQQLPAIVNAAFEIINGIVSVLSDTSNIKQIVNVAIEFVKSIGSTILKAIPMFIKTISQALPQIIAGLVMIIGKIVDELPTIIKGLLDALPDVIDSIIGGITDNMGDIIAGLITVFDKIIEKAPEILANIVKNADKIITAVLNGITDNLPDLVDGATSMIGKLAEFLKENASDIGKNVSDLITALVTAISDPEVLSDLLGAAVDIMIALANSFIDIATNKEVWNAILTAAGNIISSLWDGIKNIAKKIAEIGEYIFDKILEGFGFKSAEEVGKKWGKDFLTGWGKSVDGDKTVEASGFKSFDTSNPMFYTEAFRTIGEESRIAVNKLFGHLPSDARYATEEEIEQGKYRLWSSGGKEYAIYNPVPISKSNTVSGITSTGGGGNTFSGGSSSFSGGGRSFDADTVNHTTIVLELDKQAFGKVTYQQNKMASAIRGKALVDVGLSY